MPKKPEIPPPKWVYKTTKKLGIKSSREMGAMRPGPSAPVPAVPVEVSPSEAGPNTPGPTTTSSTELEQIVMVPEDDGVDIDVTIPDVPGLVKSKEIVLPPACIPVIALDQTFEEAQLATRKAVALKVVRGLYDLEGLGRFLSDNSFGLKQEIDILTTIAKFGSHQNKLKACAQLRALYRDLAEANGAIGTATEKRSKTAPDGTTVTQQASASHLLSALERDNPYGLTADPRTSRSLSPLQSGSSSGPISPASEPASAESSEGSGAGQEGVGDDSGDDSGDTLPGDPTNPEAPGEVL